MKKLNRLLLSSILLSSSVWATCPADLGLPGDEQINNLSNVNDRVNDDDSCSLIDKGGINDDPSLQKNFCKYGCQKQIKDDQKKVFMPEMATPKSVRTHKNWHTASAWYNEGKIRELRQKIEDKKAGKNIDEAPPKNEPGGSLNGKGQGGPGQGNGNPGSSPDGAPKGGQGNPPKLPPVEPLKMEDFYPMTDKTLTDQQVLSVVGVSVEMLKDMIMYGDIPSTCHTEVSDRDKEAIAIPDAQEKKADQKKKQDEAIKAGKMPPPAEYIQEDTFKDVYKTCVDKHWGEDLRKFIVKNQSVGGENFLYMHHKMRNQVQMLLTENKLPCIAGFTEMPGSDGKTGDHEGSWEEIWDTAPKQKLPDDVPEAVRKKMESAPGPSKSLFTDEEEADRAARGLSKKEYTELRAKELIAEALKREGGLKNMTSIFGEKNVGIDIQAKIFENEDFLKGLSLNEVGSMMEGSIHGRLHGVFDNPSGCQYQDKGTTVTVKGCELSAPQGAHIHATFWKLHGWCDDVIKKWMKAGDRDYKNIGTDDTCKETACYRMKGTWAGEMDKM